MPLITYYSPRSSDLPTALLSGRLYCVLKPRYKSIWHTYRIRDLTSWYSCGLRFKIVLHTNFIKIVLWSAIDVKFRYLRRPQNSNQSTFHVVLMLPSNGKKGEVLTKICLFIIFQTIQLSHMPPPNTRGAYFESLVSDQIFSAILVAYN